MYCKNVNINFMLTLLQFLYNLFLLFSFSKLERNFVLWSYVYMSKKKPFFQSPFNCIKVMNIQH